MKRTYAAIALAVIMAVTVASPSGLRAGEEPDLAPARQAFRDGLYDIAQSRLESFIASNRDARPLNEAHALLGRCLYRQNNLARSLDEFRIVLDSPPGSAFRDDALYWSGEIYARGLDYRKALESYQSVIDEFPASRYVGNAVYSKGWAYYKLGMTEDALKYFGNVAEKYPFENISSDALFRAG